MPASEPPTLYDWASGREAFEKLIGVEWGTRLALHNSQLGATDVPQEAPTPRWGWEIGPPHQP